MIPKQKETIPNSTSKDMVTVEFSLINLHLMTTCLILYMTMRKISLKVKFDEINEALFNIFSSCVDKIDIFLLLLLTSTLAIPRFASSFNPENALFMFPAVLNGSIFGFKLLITAW